MISGESEDSGKELIKHTNQLAGESSPYLLQHAHNPVDWYPWSDEAVARALREDKPIFLSIGYAACHWCHVMERESFEDEEIAVYLNEHFVCVKVDREERPDLDEVYMASVHLLTGGGGWPLTVFLTPTLEPFYGGTYFPPHDRYGRPGLLSVLLSISDAWASRREDVLESASSLADAVRTRVSAVTEAQGQLPKDLGARAIADLSASYDERDGGFGGAPKFPPSGAVSLLLRLHHQTGDIRARQMALHTLDAMAAGGLYDQIGGGFHRYSTDAQWLVPHFEKMLYDNALLADVYLEAFQASGNAAYRRVAEDTLDYLLSEMRDEAGGFRASEDADSADPRGAKEEGRFYLWTRAEVMSVLGPEEGAAACDYFDIREGGNFASHEPYHRGLNIPHVADSNATVHDSHRVDGWRRALRAARRARPRPERDDKVLTSWNAFTISALARAYQVTRLERYRTAAVEAADFLLGKMWQDGTLYRSYCRGHRHIPGFLDDYATLIVALVDLWETTSAPRWLDAAEALAHQMLSRFWLQETGVFFSTEDAHDYLIARPKPAYDGAEPSGNTTAALALLRLGRLLENTDYIDVARRIFENKADAMARYPQAYLRMIAVAELLLTPCAEIAIVGSASSEAFQTLVETAQRAYVPNRTLAAFDPGDADAGALAQRLPFLRGKALIDGVPAAYVCREHVCVAPVTTGDELARLLVTPSVAL